MTETDTRMCLVCGEPADAHDPDPRTADHAHEPANPTPAEAAAIVAWVRETHGTEAAAETAAEFAAANPGWPVGDHAAVSLAAEADAAKWADAR